MAQTIVIKVKVCCDKRRRKALQLAAAPQGVVSVGLKGEDQVIVTGDEVDAVCLTNSLRKKFGYAKLLSLQEVDPNGDGGDEEGGDDDNDGGDNEEESSPCCPCSCSYFHQQFPPHPPPACPNIAYVLLDADPYPTTICSIM